MEENHKSETFQYTYSAKEQEEVKRIRDKYLPKEEDKMAQLRKLDAGGSQKATMYSIMIGMIGTLILGIGMCCCMVWNGLFALGIVVGCIGIAGIILAYPLYAYLVRKEQERLAPQILKLSEELLQ